MFTVSHYRVQPKVFPKSTGRNYHHRFQQARTVEKLRKEDLTDLFEGHINALRISKFFNPLLIPSVLDRFKLESVVTNYENAPGVGRFNIGKAYFEAVESPEQMAAYYKEAQPAMDKLRGMFSPYIAPLDQVRVCLDEQWSQGCKLLNLGEGPMFVGLTRALTEQVLPHEDKLERDNPKAKEILKVKVNQAWKQFAVNCYLQVPEKGGELQL